jgi:hypothetical protein
VTRNVKHCERSEGVAVIDPWDATAGSAPPLD